MKKTNFLFVLLCVWLVGTISACTPELPSRGTDVARTDQLEWKTADEQMQSILNALDAQDADALKKLFSDYALEHTEDLNEKIEELIDFYPGCDGGYEGNVPTHRTSDYGDITYVLTPNYRITHDGGTYEMCLTIYLENDTHPERIGLHSIQVMTEDAEPDGFTWRDEDDAPGVYVLE